MRQRDFTFLPLLFFSLTVFAKVDQSALSANEKSSVFEGGLIELSLPTGSIDSKIDSEMFGVGYSNPSPFSLTFGLGLPGPNYRTYISFVMERLGKLNFGAEEHSLVNFGFKLTYDQTFKPAVTDVFLSGSLQYLPTQGARFSTNGTEFSPEYGMGLEVSIGWISPLDVTFNFGYKAVSKYYSYQRGNPITGNQDKELASVGYDGLFLTTSIGRY